MGIKTRVEGTLSFPAIFSPKAVNDGAPRYSANILIEPGSEQEKQLQAMIKEAAEEKWGKKAPQVLKQLAAQDKLCLHDGTTKDYAGYEGKKFLSAANKVKPRAVNRLREDITEADGLLYAGAKVLAVIEIWAQDNNYGKRVNASLLGVQFLEHGEPLGGGGRAADIDDFDELDDLEDEAPAGSEGSSKEVGDETPW